jgi:hypothetical protein
MLNYNLMKAFTRRSFLWGSKSKPSLITAEEELKILQYRGKIADFAVNASNFERYMKDLPPIDA